jgi:hypothetical protein
MAKLNLSRTYTYMGKDYGPGNDIDVPDDIPSGVKDVPGLRPGRRGGVTSKGSQ